MTDSAPEESRDGDPGGETDRQCDYCRLPIPGSGVTGEHEGETYTFCSEGCRDALEGAEKVFTQHHGFRRTPTGVGPIDESLPQGVPRNSFVMLTDLAGTRTGSVRAELAWRALRRGEPVVFVTFLEPPVSVVQEFVTLDWNVLPYLEAGRLRFVDAFTYRMEDRDRLTERFNDWNSHLAGFCEPATSRVRDPSDVNELENRVDDALESLDMEDRGIVVLDSLDEFGSGVQPVQAYRFVKDLRATVCKGRFVPVYASATRVRKMSGVLTLPKWVLYEYTAGEGIVTIELHEGSPDPESENEGEGESGGSGDSDAVDARGNPADE
ncbi:recombinase RecA [Halobacteriales archaeon QH_6_68_27]|nr:MAG: recombinase RecA [Halobacteriales archaeon QH_6_68_27]